MADIDFTFATFSAEGPTQTKPPFAQTQSTPAGPTSFSMHTPAVNRPAADLEPWIGTRDLPIQFYAQQSSSNSVKLTFSRAIRSYPPTLVTGNYNLTGAGGLPTVTSIGFTPGNNFLLVGLSGDLPPGSSLSLNLLAKTVQAVDDGTTNTAGGASFVTAASGGGGSNFNTGFN